MAFTQSLHQDAQISITVTLPFCFSRISPKLISVLSVETSIFVNHSLLNSFF